jgi:hypothetical protein
MPLANSFLRGIQIAIARPLSGFEEKARDVLNVASISGQTCASSTT